MTDLNSRPFRPNPQQCCEACVFGKGSHAAFCKEWPANRKRIISKLIAESRAFWLAAKADPNAESH